MKKLISLLVILFLVIPCAVAEETATLPVIDLTQIVTAVLALIAALITRYAIPWIKEKTTLEQQKRIQAAIDTVVFAAEKLYGSGKGKEKKKYVLTALRAKGFDINDEMVNAGIEAAIMALDLQVEKKPPDVM